MLTATSYFRATPYLALLSLAQSRQGRRSRARGAILGLRQMVRVGAFASVGALFMSAMMSLAPYAVTASHFQPARPIPPKILRVHRLK